MQRVKNTTFLRWRGYSPSGGEPDATSARPGLTTVLGISLLVSSDSGSYCGSAEIDLKEPLKTSTQPDWG